MRCVVSVWIRWGDYVLSVRDVRRGESLSVGSPPQRLLSFQHDAPQVWLGEPSAAQQVRALGPGETLTVRRGQLDYTLRSSGAEDAPSFAPTRRTWALWDALVLGVFFVALGGRPPKAAAAAIIPAPALAPAAQREAKDALELAPSQRALFAIVAQPEPELFKLPGEMRCGHFEPGRWDVEEVARGRYGVAGPSDNVDPHLARPVPDEGYPTATGSAGWLTPQTHTGSSAPTAAFGRDAALGTDAANARGELWGEELREAGGEAGLGAVGRAGGVSKAFDVRPVADKLDAPLRVLHTGLRVTGPRKASEVGRAMAAHFDDFRACAAALAPTNELRVQLNFDVTQDGRALATEPSAGAAEQCLTRSLSAVAFAPGASDVAHVVYPLYFVAAGADASTR